DDAAVRQTDDWLVLKLQLVILDRSSEVRSQFEQVSWSSRVFRTANLVSRFSKCLSLVHRSICASQNLSGILRIFLIGRDAYTGCDRHLMLADMEWRLQCGLDRLRDCDAVLHIDNVVEQDNKFISADSGDHIGAIFSSRAGNCSTAESIFSSNCR